MLNLCGFNISRSFFLVFVILLNVCMQWREVARELYGVIRIGAVNCADDWYLCQQKGIHSYPTLILYPEVW